MGEGEGGGGVGFKLKLGLERFAQNVRDVTSSSSPRKRVATFAGDDDGDGGAPGDGGGGGAAAPASPHSPHSPGSPLRRFQSARSLQSAGGMPGVTLGVMRRALVFARKKGASFRRRDEAGGMSRRERVKREALREMDDASDGGRSSASSSSDCSTLPDAVCEEDAEQKEFTAKFLEVFNGKEGPEARMIRLKSMQTVACFLQALFCLVTFVFAVLASLRLKTGETVFSDIFCGIVGLLSASMGIYSAVKVSEFWARVFFVCQMWTLYILTFYIYLSADDNRRQEALCDPSFASVVSLSGCAAVRSETQAKVAFAVLLCVVVTGVSSVSLDFNDAINDYDALRPMLHAHQTAGISVNVVHPNHLAYVKPTDRRAGNRWHLRFQNQKTAPDIEKSFLAVVK